MKTKLSLKRIERIREQGYTNQSNQEIADLAIGNRFAFQLCTTIVTLGVVFTSIPLISIAMTVAFLSIILPNHPFDYIYNHTLRHWLQLPKLPERSVQLKFACVLATIWMSVIVYLFSQELYTAGYVVGSIFLVVATLVSVFDYCIPSIIYNKFITK